MTRQWEAALDALLDLYLFSKSPRGRQYIAGWGLAEENDRPDLTFKRNMADLDKRIAATAFACEPIWVDPDMMTLWEAATETFEPEPLVEQDLMTPHGFVYLPRPLVWRDRWEKRTTVRAFTWTTTPSTFGDGNRSVSLRGVNLMFFHALGDVDDYDDGTGLVDKLGNNHISYRPLFRGDLIIDALTVWPFGTAHGKATTVTTTDGTEVHWGHDQQPDDGAVSRWAMERPFQCLWRLMQQTVAVREQGVPSKPFRRRWEREDLKPKGVTVIRLRRPRADTDPDHEPATVDWQNRWIVRGHWRNQWYPSLSMHRQVYIHPFMKGPEDKPLVVPRGRVFELVR